MLLQQLHSSSQNRAERHRTIYEKIYALCESHVRLRSELGEQQTLFQVPAFLFGEPKYDVERATLYLVKKLRKQGLRANFDGALVHVDWRMDKKTASTLYRSRPKTNPGPSVSSARPEPIGPRLTITIPESRIEQHLKRLQSSK